MRYLYEYKRSVPESWDELTPRQLKQCVRIMSAQDRAMQVRLALVLMGYDSFWTRWKAYFQLDAEDLYDLLSPRGYHITAFLYEYLPYFVIGGQSYHGPRQDLKDLVWYEYMLIQQHHRRYDELMESDPAQAYTHVLKVVAAIYREPKAEPDIFSPRSPLKTKQDDQRMERRAKAFAQLSPYFVMRLFDWIVIRCQSYRDTHPYIHESDPRLAKYQSDSEYGLADLVITGAEAWHISTEDFGQRSVDEVLMEMTIKKRKAVDQIERTEKPTP